MFLAIYRGFQSCLPKIKYILTINFTLHKEIKNTYNYLKKIYQKVNKIYKLSFNHYVIVVALQQYRYILY